MPKRKMNDKIERYEKKIRKLKQKELSAQRKRIRIIESDSSDSEQDLGNDGRSQNDLLEVNEGTDNPNNEEIVNTNNVQELATVAELNGDILNALGEATEDTPKFGQKIHDNLTKLWLPILRKGMDKEAKDKLLKQHTIPDNCTLLQAPKINPEISAALSENSLQRDRRIENVQRHLGAGITALNRGLELLLDDDGNKLQAVKYLSDSCRLLCGMHFNETQARRKFIIGGLDKSFVNIIKDVERDDMLFGNKLSDKIRASKVIEKQGLQIKRAPPIVKNSTASTFQPVATTSRPRPQVNWTGPPRYQSSNRGGRGGPRKAAPVGRTAPPASQSKPSGYPRQRAPTQH